MVYLEMSILVHEESLHSGHNSPETNPAWVLIHLLKSMRQTDGTITISGFHDDVQSMTDADCAFINALHHDGVDEDKQAFYRELFFEPTLNISGIDSGHTDEGKRAIIPASARTRLDIRLVPNQDPDDIVKKLRTHVNRFLPDDIESDVTELSSVKPNRTPLDHPVINPVTRAVEAAWEQEAIVQPISGGSGPDYIFDEIGLPVILVTYANADENQHGPNENMSLDCFQKGINATVNLFENFETGI